MSEQIDPLLEPAYNEQREQLSRMSGARTLCVVGVTLGLGEVAIGVVEGYPVAEAAGGLLAVLCGAGLYVTIRARARYRQRSADLQALSEYETYFRDGDS